MSRLNPQIAYRRYENNPLLPLFWDKDAVHQKYRNVIYWDGSASIKDW